MSELATIHDWPTLERPVLVVAMEGWIDAGLAAGTATATLLGAMPNELRRHLRRRRAHRLPGPPPDPADRQRGGHRAALGRHPPPRRHQPHRAQRADPDRAGARHALAPVRGRGGAAGVPPRGRAGGRAGRLPGAGAPHPAGPAGRHLDRGRAGRPGSGSCRPAIDVPSGVQGALEFAFGEAGIPAVGLWARVPHYVVGHALPGGCGRAARRPGPHGRPRDGHLGPARGGRPRPTSRSSS